MPRCVEDEQHNIAKPCQLIKFSVTTNERQISLLKTNQIAVQNPRKISTKAFGSSFAAKKSLCEAHFFTRSALLRGCKQTLDLSCLRIFVVVVCKDTGRRTTAANLKLKIPQR